MLKSKTIVANTPEEIDKKTEALYKQYGAQSITETMTTNGLGEYVCKVVMNVPDEPLTPVPNGIKSKIQHR